MVVADEGALAHFNLGLAFRQKGYYAEALREYEQALTRGEDVESCSRRSPKSTSCEEMSRAAVAAYDAAAGRAAGEPEAVERARRGAASGWPLRGGGPELPAGDRLSIPQYAIAHNNLGVALLPRGSTPKRRRQASALALRPRAGIRAGSAQPGAAALQGEAAPASLEAYRRVLARRAGTCRGLEWCRAGADGACAGSTRRVNAFARAVQSRPEYAEAHYNLSFALSNLGEFDAALRETKRAIELDPYYVPQKFELAIDFQYEHPELSIVPGPGGARARDGHHGRGFRVRRVAARFAVHVADAGGSDVEPRAAAGAIAFGIALDYLSKGLYDRAAAEISRALLRGADRARA